MNFRPFVSIVVCISRNPLIFKQCFQSLLEQTYPPDLYEIILVDAMENSQVERIFSSSVLRIVKSKSTSPGAMLNVGIKAANGEIVAFTDADCAVEPSWLSKLVNGFSESQVAGVGGNVIIKGRPSYNLVSEAKTDDKGYLLFDKNRIIPSRGPIKIVYFLGANCAFRKLILEKIGNFLQTPPDVGGQDVDICVRLLSNGYRLKFVNAVVYHPVRSVKSRIINAIRDGRALCLLLRLHKPTLLKSTFLRLVENIIWNKGGVLMLIGFINESIRQQQGKN